jgi:hypothetical protein
MLGWDVTAAGLAAAVLDHDLAKRREIAVAVLSSLFSLFSLFAATFVLRQLRDHSGDEVWAACCSR